MSDDVEMEITHVVRGDDHISNTPKQMLLYQGVGAPVPQFAHVPLILGPDKKRLSKRHGATSVMEYARQGYLPEAMVNFLALLGWSPGSGDRELFTRDELVARVRARGHQRRQRRVQPGEARLVQPAAHRAARARRARAPAEAVVRGGRLWDDEYLGDRHAWFFAVLELLKPRAKRLDDSWRRAASSSPTARVRRGGGREASAREGMARASRGARRGVRGAATFDPASIEAALRLSAEARGVKAATLIHAARVAVTGKAVSPGLFEVLALLGRDGTRARLRGRSSSLGALARPEPCALLFLRKSPDQATVALRVRDSFPIVAARVSRPAENVFLSACMRELQASVVAHRLQPERFARDRARADTGMPGRREWWRKKIADLRRWTEASSGRSRAKAARRRTRRARRTSGRARKRAKRAARAAWRATGGSRSSRAKQTMPGSADRRRRTSSREQMMADNESAAIGRRSQCQAGARLPRRQFLDLAIIDSSRLSAARGWYWEVVQR